MVEVHGKVGEHKVKKNSAGVDLADDDAAVRCPAWPSRLRGVAIAPGTNHEVKYTIADDAKPAELAGKEVSLNVTIKEARERKTPASTTSWPRTPARPTRSRS